MHRQNSEPASEPECQSEFQVETDDQDDDPLEIAALEAEVDFLLQGVQVDSSGLEFDSDLDSSKLQIKIKIKKRNGFPIPTAC